MIALASGCSASAAEPALQGPLPVSAIDAIVDSLVGHHATGRGVPGLAVVIVSDDRVVVQRAFGVRDLQTRQPVTLATPFNLASLTKPFTALAALRLSPGGRLRLEAPAREYLRWLPSRYRDVTVRQLLTHTAGVARDLRRDNFDDPSVEEYRRRLDSADASGAPGRRYEYSNTGYAILGWVIEAAAGKPLGQVLRELVFQPLDMRQAGYRGLLEGDPERARPHAVKDGRTAPAGYVSGGFGSGGMTASGADLAAFAVALQAGRALDSREAPVSWTPGALRDGSPVRLRMFVDSAGYGLGWFLTVFRGHRLVTHGGAIEGFSSNLYHFPERRLTIALVANAKARDDGRAPVDSLAQDLAAFCLAQAACRPAESAEPREARLALAAANQAFSRAYLAGDTAALRAAYTADAVALPPSGRIVAGPRAIASLFAPPADRRRVAHALFSERLVIHGETALEAGTWYEAWERDGATRASSGRYALSWRREHGVWRMTSDAWWSAPPGQ